MNTFPVSTQNLSPSPWGALLQSWEGHVTAIGPDGIDVVLEDKTDLEESDIFARLKWNAIDPEDKPLVKEGAVFYWSVSENGSLLRFRRGLRWTPELLALTQQRAHALFSGD